MESMIEQEHIIVNKNGEELVNDAVTTDRELVSMIADGCESMKDSHLNNENEEKMDLQVNDDEEGMKEDQRVESSPDTTHEGDKNIFDKQDVYADVDKNVEIIDESGEMNADDDNEEMKVDAGVDSFDEGTQHDHTNVIDKEDVQEGVDEKIETVDNNVEINVSDDNQKIKEEKSVDSYDDITNEADKEHFDKQDSNDDIDETFEKVDTHVEMKLNDVNEENQEEKFTDDVDDQMNEEEQAATNDMNIVVNHDFRVSPAKANLSSELMRIVTGRSSIFKTEENDSSGGKFEIDNHYSREDDTRYVDKPVIVKSESLDDQYPLTNQSKKEIDDSFDATYKNTNSSGRTIINGCGIWNSWTRNFSSPLLALLDLFDNALDASTMHLSQQQQINDINCGRIHVDADKDNSERKTTGIKMVNSSVLPIKPLKEVFEVYGNNDTGMSSSSRIGENGVGLKQGCATLSDLSFCLVKNHGNQFSLGMLAWQLQTLQRFSLPSIQFRSTSADDLEAEMTQQFLDGKSNSDFALCIRQYGGGLDDSLKLGIRRIAAHFQAMSTGDWESHDHVFTLIVHGLKHSGAAQSHSENGALGCQDDRVVSLLQTLYDDLPKRYLHAPNRKDLIVNVSEKPVCFDYWRPRLLEMAQFDLLINESTRVISDPDFSSFYFDENRPEKKDVYRLRVYTGFDVIRACDDTDKTASMCIYSRRSGRLIKIISDCRAELGLANTGTKYCQGVTLIVDDIDGRIPLNPTKQDFAFGEQSNGEIHKYNLYIWCNIALRCFYYYHLALFDGKIALMGGALKVLENETRSLVAKSHNSDNFRKIRDCQFTTFASYASKIIHGKQTIRLQNKNDIIRTVRKDTLLQFSAELIQTFASQSGAASKQSLDDGDEIGESERVSGSIDSDNFINRSDILETKPPSAAKLSSPKKPSEPKKEKNPLKRKRLKEECKTQEPKKPRTKKALLELENNRLKKEWNLERDGFLAELALRSERIKEIEQKYKVCKRQLLKQAEEVSTYRQKAKQHEKAYSELLGSAASSSSDRKTIIPDLRNTTTISNKKLRNLNSTIELLKNENEDLKEQIGSLQTIVKRKDQTITKQRTLIYQRDNEDDSDDSDE